MIGHNYIYGLETVKGIPNLSIKLGLNIIAEDKATITIKLPTGETTLLKSEYLNSPYTKNFRFYDDKETFFILCTKSVSRVFAFKTLLAYASKKLEKQINARQNLKFHCDRLLVA